MLLYLHEKIFNSMWPEKFSTKKKNLIRKITFSCFTLIIKFKMVLLASSFFPPTQNVYLNYAKSSTKFLLTRIFNCNIKQNQQLLPDIIFQHSRQFLIQAQWYLVKQNETRHRYQKDALQKMQKTKLISNKTVKVN